MNRRLASFAALCALFALLVVIAWWQESVKVPISTRSGGADNIQRGSSDESTGPTWTYTP